MGINAGMFFGGVPIDFVGFIRPDDDIETSGFSTTPLWQKLDEENFDDATTQIASSIVTSVCFTNTDHDFEVRLSDPAGPPTGNETITVRVRARIDEIIGAAITKNLLFELKEGSVVKASSSVTLQAGYTTHTDVLSQAQKDSISDWNNLSIRCRARICVENSGDQARSRFTWIEVEFA